MTFRPGRRFSPAFLVLAAAAAACDRPASAEEPAPSPRPATSDAAPKKAKPAAGKDEAGKPLFDGKTLAGWKSTEFGGEGEVKVADGAIVLGTGSDLTGVTYAGELPKVDYELRLDAKRVDGADFFCGLTFPVRDEHCSLIVGGWGGGVVGLSSLNGFDASENPTTTYREFKNGQWYAIRLRVTGQRITAWIDDKEILDADTRDVKLSTRIEVEASKPLGIASWRTTAALKNLRLRPLPPEEVKAVHASLPPQ